MPVVPPASKIQAWIGQYIGNYRLVRLLGEGSMGMVFEGLHEGVGGRAAIKILRPEITSRADLAARFFNEARAANACQHPGIVRIFDSGYTEAGVAFLSMEYLDGQSLGARLFELKKLPVRDALRVGRQIASALLAAHRKNIIHRDLKPDNIMLVPDPDLPGGERVKILDFGIAKIAEGLGATPLHTRTDLLIGTPLYMAPEQCRGAKGVTDRSDVYSLGVILYKMLAGRAPFLGQSTAELLAMHLMDPVPPLDELAPGVGATVVALVHSMLEKAPLQRPAMDAVVEQLQRLEKDPGALAGPPTTQQGVVSPATVVHEVVVAPTTVAPIVVAPADSTTTRQQIALPRRGIGAVLAALGEVVISGSRGRRVAMMVGSLAVLGTGVLVVQKSCAKQSTGVEIRHRDATGSGTLLPAPPVPQTIPTEGVGNSLPVPAAASASRPSGALDKGNTKPRVRKKRPPD